MKGIVTADLPRLAASLEAQEREITDEADLAGSVRRPLIRAAAYLRLAYGELVGLPLVMTDQGVGVAGPPDLCGSCESPLDAPGVDGCSRPHLGAFRRDARGPKPAG